MAPAKNSFLASLGMTSARPVPEQYKNLGKKIKPSTLLALL
jgi:hypothetical protein